MTHPHQAPQRILVVMPNWYGETLFATPFLRALHDLAPQASISALGPARAEAMLARHPGLREFLLYDETASHRGWRAAWRTAAQIRARRYDTAVILRRSLTRTALVACAGVPRRIGFANAKSGWLLTHRVPRPPAPRHKAEEYLELLRPLGGGAPPRLACEYAPSPEEHAQAAQLLRDAGIGERQQPFIVLHPGANWAHKRWPAESFAELAADLMRDGMPVLVTGAAADQPLADAILARMVPDVPALLVGRTAIRQLAAVLERARLVVSNDTGALHLAVALRRPVVALYGPTSPVLTGPYGDPAVTRVIHHPGCCPIVPCSQPDHPGFPGMRSITVEEVARAARDLLQRAAAA